MEEKKKKKFNLFDMFNSQRIGRGVEKGEVKEPTFKNFFKYFGRSFSKLLNINLMFTLFCVPLFFALFAIAGYFDQTVPAAADPTASVLNGLIINGQINPLTMTLFGVYGIKTGSASQISVMSLVFYGIAALTVFTWGYANSGLAYSIRNLQKGEPVFVWSDYFRTVKKNAVQALIVGLIDITVIALLFYNLRFYSYNSSKTVFFMLYVATVIMMLMYAVMRTYLYPMLVTFDLSTLKLFKNALIFTFIGLKRNIVGLIGMAVAVALNALLFWAFMPLGIILPFVLTVAVCGYIGIYAAYPKIKEVMIDPYYDEYGNPKEEKEEEKTEVLSE
ncbi:MAG: DUF624 domain-containing protein [Clostridia bacterium]|nr:DUF624 domain-containing protein [Clostridia bacterium]